MQTWQVISPQQVEQIHQTTLRILGEVGILLDHSETRQLLLDAGAAAKEDRIVFPPQMVEDCLAKCGGPVQVSGRSGLTAGSIEKDGTLGGTTI